IQRQVGAVKAVDGVSLTIHRGETLGLVGESGCGKTTLGRVILRLMEPTSGEAFFEGRNIFKLTKEELRRLRRDMQIIFQDPYSSLNPRMTVGDIIGEPLEIHNLAHGKEKVRRVQELLEVVGLSPYHMNRYPHEFSGGQRQRIILPGDVPSPVNPPSGCRFHTRCLYAQDSCRVDDPELVDYWGNSHFVACPILPFKHQRSKAAVLKQPTA